MESKGIVRAFDQDSGVGVIDSPDTPGGCWVHFSAIDMDGYRALDPGEEVTFSFESVPQDGFSHRALEVRRKGVRVRNRPVPPRVDSDSAYTSELRITYPDGQVKVIHPDKR
jgi:cold shock protein